MLNNALAGRNRSASDVSRFRLSSVQLRNHEVGYFDPLLWAVCVMICVATFCIGGKCSVVLCLKNRKYGGVSSLNKYRYRTPYAACVTGSIVAPRGGSIALWEKPEWRSVRNGAMH